MPGVLFALGLPDSYASSAWTCPPEPSLTTTHSPTQAGGLRGPSTTQLTGGNTGWWLRRAGAPESDRSRCGSVGRISELYSLGKVSKQVCASVSPSVKRI